MVPKLTTRTPTLRTPVSQQQQRGKSFTHDSDHGTTVKSNSGDSGAAISSFEKGAKQNQRSAASTDVSTTPYPHFMQPSR
jgi:hypothetical protein